MKNSLCYVLLLIISALWQKASAQQSDTLFLYFDVSKSELSVEELNKLNAFCESNAKITKEIILEAYADSTGSEANNQALSAKRMDVVKSHLKNTKESFKNIVKDSAMGETIKYGNDFQLNRCVELIFIYDEKKNINNLAAYAKGDKIVLENILFENNTDIFLPSSLTDLQTLLGTLKANPSIKIMILGHVCCGGNNPDYDGVVFGPKNMKISEARAKAVCNYLLENGIENDRLKYRGLSFKYPRVFPENSEEDRGKNRRVEIEIL
jgi:outer membrane protein OmpA-like peptidoglycan-associated protein